MSWVRFVPGFSRHPKRIKCGPISSWLWACSVDYCMEHLTDGFLDEAIVPSLCASITGSAMKRAIENLVAVGSWERVSGGYLVHDYLRHNLSKDQVEADQAAARERHLKWKRTRHNNAVAGGQETALGTHAQHRSDNSRSQSVGLSGANLNTSNDIFSLQKGSDPLNSTINRIAGRFPELGGTT